MLCLFAALVTGVIVLLTLERKCLRLIWQLNGLLGVLQQPLLWLLLILYLRPKGIMEGMQRWRKYFHHPLGIIIGTRILLFVDDPNTIAEILSAHECQDKTFLQDGFFARKGLLHARGQQWKIRRKQLNPAFGHSILLSFFHIFNSVGNQLQNAFSEKLQETAVCYKDVEDLLSRAVLEVSCLTTLGTETNFTTKDADGIARTYKKLLEISALRIIKPWLQNDRLFRLLDRSSYEVYVTCNKLVQGFVEAIVQRKHKTWLAEKLLVAKERPAATSSSSSSSAASAFANAEEIIFTGDFDSSGCNETAIQTTQKRIFIEQIFHLATLGEMTLEDIINETHAMVLVSFETVSNTLIIALLLLAMHPDCQSKLRCEINETFANEQARVSTDAERNIFDIDAIHLQRMKYLDMIVNESLRLLTTVPMNLRHVSSDFQLQLRHNNPEVNKKCYMTDFVVVPRDSIIVVDTFNMHRDSRHWGPKSQEFIPERFATTQTRHPYAFIPFSKGLRTCIGTRYSMFLMKVFLVKLISSYEFRTQTQLSQLRFIQGISLKFENADTINFAIRQLRVPK